MHIIRVKFLSATNTRGARFKCSFVGFYEFKPKTYSYSYSAQSPETQAAIEYFNDTMGESCRETGAMYMFQAVQYDQDTKSWLFVFSYTGDILKCIVRDMHVTAIEPIPSRVK